MPKKTKLKVEESVEFLENEIFELKDSLKLKDVLKSDRLKTLLWIKGIEEGKCFFQSHIADDIGRTEKTIRTWIKEYSENGYTGLLKEKRGGNNTRKISDKAVKHIVKFLKKEKISILIKISSAEEAEICNYGLSSFSELKLQIEKGLGEIISYDTLYYHLKKNHKKEFNFLKGHFSEKKVAKKNPQRSKEQSERAK